MEDVEQLVKTAMGEIERLLSSKTVVGDPIQIEGHTVIPLMSVGFGFGAGGGTGRMQSRESGEGAGGGTGGGGGIKPVALIIADKNGVRLEAIKGAASSVFEKAVEVIGKAALERREKSGD